MVNSMLVENLGPIKRCEIRLGQETILLGRNNSGKTYISYLLYGMYKRIDRKKKHFILAFLKEKMLLENYFVLRVNKSELANYLLNELVKDLNLHLTADLPRIFNTNKEDFIETTIKIEHSDIADFIDHSIQNYRKKTNKLRMKTMDSTLTTHIVNTDTYWELALDEAEVIWDEDDTLKPHYTSNNFLKSISYFFREHIFKMPTILYIPAERNGINVFRKELNMNRSSQTFLSNSSALSIEKYPLPIADYMQYLNRIDLHFDEERAITEKRTNVWNAFSVDILKGKYEYDAQKNNYYYREIESSSDEETQYKEKKIPLQISSSSTKSLFGLEYYLKHLYSAGDILFIDEPEMNLDPENQTKFAELLVDLSSEGVKVILSSHSDYLTRATTNKMLEAKVKDQQTEQQITAYYFDAHTVNALGDLSEVEYIDIFDDMNTTLEDQYFLLKDTLRQNDRT